jgi:hypothetical protein
VVFIEYLLARSIKRSALQRLELLAFEFVSKLEELYPKQIMLSGVHEILHLVDCTKELIENYYDSFMETIK